MANIRTIFTLVDNVSPGLRAINQNLGVTTSNLMGISAGIQIFNALSSAVRSFVSQIDELTDAYAAQYESEVKLYTIMRQRMNATAEDFNAIKNLAQAMEGYGVLSDKVILKGAQELASFVQTKQELVDITEAVANLTVQQYGYNASADQMRQISTSIGKMLNGTVSGLSKLGLAFTDEEKKMLKSNDMAMKVDIVLKRINEKVGLMNEAMGKTNIGRIQSLKNQLESVNEELGRLAQPLRIVGLELRLAFRTKVLELFGKALQWINKNAETISKAVLYFGSVVLVLVIAKLALVIYKLGIIIAMQAILHWKTTLIIAAVLAIFLLLNKMGVPIEKIFGKIANGVTQVAVLIRNVFAALYNSIIVPIYNAIATIIEGIRKAKNFLTGNWGSDDWKVERLNRIEYKSAYKTGKEVENSVTTAAGKLGDYIKNATSGFQVDMPEVDVLNGAMAVYDKDLIEIAEDYRDLLSKRAVERFNLQLARISPSVTIEKVDVHKEADASNVLDVVVNAIEDFSNSSLSTARGR